MAAWTSQAGKEEGIEGSRNSRPESGPDAGRGPYRYLRYLVLLGLPGCSGVQSSLDPAGEEAVQVANLFWTMVGGGTVIWLGVTGTLLYAMQTGRTPLAQQTASRLIFWAGAVLPSATLLLLLAYALWLMPGLRPFAQLTKPGSTRIEVTGRQFWWQVVYHPANGVPVMSANEIRLPVGERVELTLKSADVIHSFWIPALGGKMDMIPGRTNRLSLIASKPGFFRGPCAEFCGTSHALMAFSVVTMEIEDFNRWLAAQAQPARTAAGEGEVLFLRHGCGSCHTVSGTGARGIIGPDLSHIGSRRTVAAGILANSQENIARFIVDPATIKPGASMPAFGMLPPQDIRAIAGWLKGLQ
jgi:cytochrome c oxidase subunit 2